jgi:hypothetical protein
MRSRKRRRHMVRQWSFRGRFGIIATFREFNRRQRPTVSKTLGLPDLFQKLYAIKQKRKENP